MSAQASSTTTDAAANTVSSQTTTGTVTSSATGCPTVTLTSSICSSCATPDCVQIEPITQGCGCPSAIPTVFVDYPCESACKGLGCAANYVFFTENCTSPTSVGGNSGVSSNATAATNTNASGTPTGSGTGALNSTSKSAGGSGGALTTLTSTATSSGSRTPVSSVASGAAFGRARPFWVRWM